MQKQVQASRWDNSLKDISNLGVVLRMLASYVGEDRFLKGVSIYLKKHLYANSVTKDLWEGIAEASGTFIPQIIWILVLIIGRSRCAEGHGQLGQEGTDFECGASSEANLPLRWASPS